MPYRSLWLRGDSLAGGTDVIEYCDFGRSLLDVGDRSRDEDDPLCFLTWLPRPLLRNAPILAYVYLAVEVVTSFQSGGAAAFPWEFLQVHSPPLSTAQLVYLLLVSMFGFVVAALLAETTGYPIPWRTRVVRSLEATSVLSFGAVVGVFVFTHFTTGGTTDPVNAEYALLLLVGGYLVYDGMLRTEFLFQHLDQGERLWRREEYGRLRREMAKCLDRFRWSSWNGVVLGLFALWFVVVVGWTTLSLLPAGSSNLAWAALRLADRLLLWITRAVIVLVAINFIVLLWYVSRLSDSSNENPTFRFHPFHPDELGGFRDLGKFASRVNVLLILGGFYAVYRIVVFDLTGPIDGIAPLVLYGIVTVVWFYFTFWKLHLRMVEGVRWSLSDRETPVSELWAGAYGDRPTWEALRRAPRWPITNRRLTELLSANLLPLAIAVANYLYPSALG